MSWRDIQDRAIVSMSIVLGILVFVAILALFGYLVAGLCVRARVANAKELYRVFWRASFAKTCRGMRLAMYLAIEVNQILAIHSCTFSCS